MCSFNYKFSCFFLWLGMSLTIGKKFWRLNVNRHATQKEYQAECRSWLLPPRDRGYCTRVFFLRLYQNSSKRMRPFLDFLEFLYKPRLCCYKVCLLCRYFSAILLFWGTPKNEGEYRHFSQKKSPCVDSFLAWLGRCTPSPHTCSR